MGARGSKESEIGSIVEQATARAGLSKRALATRARIAPETVSRICRRGTGDFATVSRLVRASGLRLKAVAVERDPETSASRASDHRRLDARSLALHTLIAGKLLANPALLPSRVLSTIWRFKKVHANTGSQVLIEVWERAALSGVEALARLCVDPSETGNQLRQASPMTGVLLPRERRWIYDAFAA